MANCLRKESSSLQPRDDNPGQQCSPTKGQTRKRWSHHSVCRLHLIPICMEWCPSLGCAWLPKSEPVQPLMKGSSLKEWRSPGDSLYISFMQLPTSSVPSPAHFHTCRDSQCLQEQNLPCSSASNWLHSWLCLCGHVVPFFCHPLNHQSSCFPASKLLWTFLICHRFLFCVCCPYDFMLSYT